MTTSRPANHDPRSRAAISEFYLAAAPALAAGDLGPVSRYLEGRQEFADILDQEHRRILSLEAIPEDPLLPAGVRLLHKLHESRQGEVYVGIDTRRNSGSLVQIRRHRADVLGLAFASEAARIRETGTACFLYAADILENFYGCSSVHEFHHPVRLLSNEIALRPRALDRDARLRHQDAVLQVMVELGRDLDSLHEKGIVHGGITPDAVFLDAANRAFLLGLTWKLPINADAILSFPLDESYRAPEYWDGSSSPLTPAVDVWSLGVILYEVLGSRRPFAGGTPRELLAAIGRGAPGLYRADEIPHAAALLTVLTRSMQLDPGRRFPRSGPFAEALAQARFGDVTDEKASAGGWSPVKRGLLLALPLILAVGLGFALKEWVRPSISVDTSDVIIDPSLSPESITQTLGSLPEDATVLFVAGHYPELTVPPGRYRMTGLEANGVQFARVRVLPTGEDSTITLERITIAARSEETRPLLSASQVAGKLRLVDIILDTTQAPGVTALELLDCAEVSINGLDVRAGTTARLESPRFAPVVCSESTVKLWRSNISAPHEIVGDSEPVPALRQIGGILTVSECAFLGGRLTSGPTRGASAVIVHPGISGVATFAYWQTVLVAGDPTRPGVWGTSEQVTTFELLEAPTTPDP